MARVGSIPTPSAKHTGAPHGTIYICLGKTLKSNENIKGIGVLVHELTGLEAKRVLNVAVANDLRLTI